MSVCHNCLMASHNTAPTRWYVVRSVSPFSLHSAKTACARLHKTSCKENDNLKRCVRNKYESTGLWVKVTVSVKVWFLLALVSASLFQFNTFAVPLSSTFQVRSCTSNFQLPRVHVSAVIGHGSAIFTLTKTCAILLSDKPNAGSKELEIVFSDHYCLRVSQCKYIPKRFLLSSVADNSATTQNVPTTRKMLIGDGRTERL